MKKFILLLIAILVMLQFFGIDKSTPEYDADTDFSAIEQPPEEIRSVLKAACYSCHSYKTEYPWYSNIQPVAWWLKNHIDEGREHLNFSVWGIYNLEERQHKIDEMIEEVDEGKMPLNSYTWIHAEARLSPEQKTDLTSWLNSKKNK